MADFMNTREVAEYLRVRERKIYELLGQHRIPASRVAGKWLFPRALIDLWVLGGAEGIDTLRSVATPPPVIAGSHDPLLEWAVRESGCELALMFDGSMDGLARFADARALACGCHVRDAATGAYNVPVVAATALPRPSVVIEWAWREQGLIVPRGNPRGLRTAADLVSTGARVAGRQAGAGSGLLLEALLREAGHEPDELVFMEPPARNETDVALAVVNGSADAGLGIGAIVSRFGLDFVPVARERYDMVIGRRDFFEPPFQRLLAFTRTPRFTERAADLGGYEVHGCGAVHWNSPAP